MHRQDSCLLPVCDLILHTPEEDSASPVLSRLFSPTTFLPSPPKLKVLGLFILQPHSGLFHHKPLCVRHVNKLGTMVHDLRFQILISRQESDWKEAQLPGEVREAAVVTYNA